MREDAAANAAQSWRETPQEQDVPSAFTAEEQLRAMREKLIGEEVETPAPGLLSGAQAELLPLVTELPEDFPFEDWDTLSTKQQRRIMEQMDLSREEQWILLNATTSIRTIADIWALVHKQEGYGLTDDELISVITQLQDIGALRTGAQTHSFYLGSDQRQDAFLRYIKELEEEVYGWVEKRAAKGSGAAAQFDEPSDAWYNMYRAKMQGEYVTGNLSDYPAVSVMLDACALTNEQFVKLSRTQKKLDALNARGDATQQEIDDVLAEACNIMLDEAAIEKLSLYERTPDGEGGWVPDKELPQKKVYAYTKEIDRLFREAAIWATAYRAAECITNFWGDAPIYNTAVKVATLSDFINRVRTDGIWDVKNQDSWQKSVMGGDEAEKESPGSSSYGFVYGGELLTAQELGNILYGYVGSAIGLPAELLYFAGGVVQNISDDRSLPNWELSRSRLYGDTPEDRDCVEKGVHMYREGIG